MEPLRTPLAMDTSVKQTNRYFELLRARTNAERLSITAALCTGVRKVAEMGIRHRYPAAGEDEVRVRLTKHFYGADVARRLHGWVPEGL